MEPTNYLFLGIKMKYSYELENVDVIYEDEFFIPIIFYNLKVLDNYMISNYGRIYSMVYKKLMKQFLDEGGYYRIKIYYEPGKKIFTGVHKLELMSFCPIKENSLYIPNHKDGNKTNNYIGNLEWMTISENTRHALDNGLANYKCENNSRSYISNETVHMICKFLESGKEVSYILDELDLPYGQERNRMAAIIRLIRKGQTYTDISYNYNIPGIKGKKRYEPEMTEKVCRLMSDGNIYRIDQFCDILNIELDDRKMFRNYVDDVFADKTHSFITKCFPNKKRPLNISKNDPYYYFYN